MKKSVTFTKISKNRASSFELTNILVTKKINSNNKLLNNLQAKALKRRKNQ